MVLLFPIVKLSVDALSTLDDQYELSENGADEERSDETNNSEEEENMDEVEEYILHDYPLLAQIESISTITFVHRQNQYSVYREFPTPPPRFM